MSDFHAKQGALTFDWNYELWHHWQDLLRASFGEQILDSVDGDENVRMLVLSQTVKQKRQIIVIIEILQRDLEKISRSTK